MDPPENKKHAWFIWLSFLGLAWLSGKQSFQYAVNEEKWEDSHLNRHMGYTGRLLGMLLAGFVISCLLMLCCTMDRMPEPWYTVWNCIILAYAYFSGVFITWRLYRYLSQSGYDVSY